MIPIKGPSNKEVATYKKALAHRLRNLRDERGLKRSWVAKQLGVHYNTIKNWELGTAWPGAKELLHLAKVYNIEPEEFYIGINPPELGAT